MKQSTLILVFVTAAAAGAAFAESPNTVGVYTPGAVADAANAPGPVIVGTSAPGPVTTVSPQGGGVNAVYTTRGEGNAFYVAQGEPVEFYAQAGAEPPATLEEAPGSAAEDAKLEAELEAARKKLDEAAHEVAELSTRMGTPFVQKFMTFNGGPDRAIIGVQLDPSSGKDGARVREVSPGGPAAEAGVRAGDVIVAVNGTEVKGEDTARQVIKIMRDVKPDSKVSVRVLRDGKTRDFTIAARPGIGNMAFATRIPGLPDLPSLSIATMSAPFMIRGGLADMELATLTPKLGHYFGTDKGVLVVRAPADEGFKLEDGDVIVSIDGREPTSGSHATRILASYQPGEKIALKIMRDHKSMNLETKLPDGPGPGRPRKMLILPEGKRVLPAEKGFVIHKVEEGV